MKTQTWCCSLAGLLLLCGCAGDESSILGTVNLDGKPVAEGDIRFIPIEANRGSDAGAVIRDGKCFLVPKHPPRAVTWLAPDTLGRDDSAAAPVSDDGPDVEISRRLLT